MWGRHLTECYQGFVFSQSDTPLGLAIPIYTGTALAGGSPIWNPPGSGVNVELIRIDIAYGSGTADFGAIGLMVRPDTIAGAALFSAFADTTPFNNMAGSGRATKVRSSNAGTVTASAGAAGDWKRTLANMNLEAQTGTAHGTIVASYDFDGTLVLTPGYACYIAATKASVALYNKTVVWKEIPISA